MVFLNLLAAAIGVGLLLTIILTEAVGLAAGGLVVPGYMALHLLQPWSFGLTLALALLSFFIVRTLSMYIIIYGRRRTALMILTGYLLGAGCGMALGGGFVVDDGVAQAAATGAAPALAEPQFFEISVIGYIIPGLIALWFDRQGVLPTISGLLVTAVLVRLVLIVAMPEAMLAHEAQELASTAAWMELLGEGGGK